MKKKTFIGLTALAVGVAAAPLADACTRILWNDNKLAVVAGRTMDFPVSTEPVLTVLPRGIEHDGGMFAGKPFTLLSRTQLVTARLLNMCPAAKSQFITAATIAS